jgi:regulator of protease activity HflC (stomatin/prohibitin superfamily)
MKRSSILGVLMLIVLAFTQQSCMERIDVGNVGLKVSLSGSEKGVSSTDYVNGYNFYMPFVSTIVEYNTRVQTVDYDEYSVGAKGGTVFIAHPKLTYRVIRTKAHVTYNNFGTDDLDNIQEGYLHTAMTKALGDVGNKYTPDSLLIAREGYENEVQKHMKALCDTFGLEIITFRANLSPPATLVDAITQKQKVEQENQKLEQQKLSVQIAGEKEVIQATLSAKASVAQAEGAFKSAEFQAKANKELQASYTDNFVKMRWIEAWESGGAQVPQYQLGSNTQMLMQMPK